MTIKEVSEKFHITQDTLRYYEKIGMIPPVNRTSGGIRDYTEKDIGWVDMAVCMRKAGLPIEVMMEYVRLFGEGDTTIPARLELLIKQREELLNQRKQLDMTIQRLEYKISRYEKAVETGKLTWDEEQCR